MTPKAMTPEKPRWQYRFDSFHKSHLLLQEAMERYDQDSLDQLGKEGTIQRFEICIELAWKTIRDYMEYNNVVLDKITPNSVIKEAFATKLIADGEGWMMALDARNKMSHTYDLERFELVLRQIGERYLKCFGQLHETLLTEHRETDNA